MVPKKEGSMLRLSWLVVLVMLVLVGCCKKEEGAPPEKGPEAAEAAKPEKAGPFADFDLDAVKTKLQGAWVIRNQAWEVRGNQVTIFDGQKEKTEELEIVSPCKIGLVTKTERGSSTDYLKYTSDGEKLYVGMGNAGVRHKDAIVACGFNAVLVHKEDKCTAFKQGFRGDWESEPAECGIEKRGEDEFFNFKAGMTRGSLKIMRNALLSAQMERNVAEKVASFEEAKGKLKK